MEWNRDLYDPLAEKYSRFQHSSEDASAFSLALREIVESNTEEGSLLRHELIGVTNPYDMETLFPCQIGDGSDLASVSWRLSNLAHCIAVISDANGTILEANSNALENEKFAIGTNLQDLGLLFSDLKANSSQQKESVDELGSENTLTLVKVEQLDPAIQNFAVRKLDPDSDGRINYLVICLKADFATRAIQLLGQKFNLTNTELEISKSVFEGRTLKSISEARGRSYKTIRNQFQGVLEKTECRSDIEFIRFVNGLGQIVSPKTNNVAMLPQLDCQKLQFPRTNGRKTELVIFGAEGGKPIFCLPGFFGHTITKKMIDQAKRANVQILSISRPDHGGTSGPPTEDDICDCLIGDVKLVLTSLELKNVDIVARGSAVHAGYLLALFVPDIIKSLTIVSGNLSRSYYSNKSIPSVWTRAVLAVPFASRAVFRSIFRVAVKLVNTEKPTKLFQNIHKNSKSDVKYFQNAENAQYFLQSVLSNIENGIEGCVRDMVLAASEWADLLNNLTIPVKLLHGTEDGSTPIEVVREFAADFPEFLTLKEIPGAGWQLYNSHFEVVVSEVAQGVKWPEKIRKTG